MKKTWLLLAGILVLALFASISVAKIQQQTRLCDQDCCVCEQFVDVDGDGICDNCDGCLPKGEDDDGDGIPNGQDDDYVPSQDGTGDQNGR